MEDDGQTLTYLTRSIENIAKKLQLACVLQVACNPTCRNLPTIVSDSALFPRRRWCSMEEHAERVTTSLIKVRADRLPLDGGVSDEVGTRWPSLLEGTHVRRELLSRGH